LSPLSVWRLVAKLGTRRVARRKSAGEPAHSKTSRWLRVILGSNRADKMPALPNSGPRLQQPRSDGIVRGGSFKAELGSRRKSGLNHENRLVSLTCIGIFAASRLSLIHGRRIGRGAQNAREQNRAVFLFFTGSDWCGWCQRLNAEVLATKEFLASLKRISCS
jgi:hypothetical protein